MATSGRAPGLDLLRALAIAAVMLYHLSSHGIALPAFVEHGWMGVDLFFVLSGYLVGWQLLRAVAGGAWPSWRGYLANRALRILPAYFAVLLLYVALPGWREAASMQPLWKYLTFTVNLWPDWSDGTAYSHAWSLCVEMHFYLLLPLVVWLLARRASVVKTIAAAAALVGGGILLRAWLWTDHVAPALADDDAANAVASFVEQIYDPTWTRLDGLLSGVLLAAVRAFRPGWWAWLMERGAVLLALGVAVLAACTRIPGFSMAGAVVLFPLVAFGCGCLVAGALGTATFAGRRPLPGARLGATLAYSLYLTHKEVYGLLDGWLPGLGARMPIMAMCVYVLASLAVAVLLYVTVERPGLRLRGRRLPGVRRALS